MIVEQFFYGSISFSARAGLGRCSRVSILEFVFFRSSATGGQRSYPTLVFIDATPVGKPIEFDPSELVAQANTQKL